jgi:hypothetical protein
LSFLNATINPRITPEPISAAMRKIVDEAPWVSFWESIWAILAACSLTVKVVALSGKAYCCSVKVYWEYPLASKALAAVWLYATRLITQLPPFRYIAEEGVIVTDLPYWDESIVMG